MSDWFVGQRVVCVDGDLSLWPPEQIRAFVLLGVTFPVRGSVYTIDDLFIDPYWRDLSLRLREIRQPELHWALAGSTYEHGYSAHRFRPVVSPHADISVFEPILDRLNQREVVDA